MISNMDMRVAFIKNADTIIKNNQLITNGNCNEVMKIVTPTELTQSPYLMTTITDLYNYFTLEKSDMKEKYLSDYMYSSKNHNPFFFIKKE
jgi:hypothetical protein